MLMGRPPAAKKSVNFSRLVAGIPRQPERFEVFADERFGEVSFTLVREDPADAWIIVYRGSGIGPRGVPENLEVVNIEKITVDETRMVVIKKPTTRFITITSFDENQTTPRLESGPRFVGWNVPISMREFQLKLDFINA